MKDVTSAKGLSELRTAITSRVHAKPARKGTAHLDLYLLSMEKQRLETELARLEQRRRHIHEHLVEINQAMSALEEEAKKELMDTLSSVKGVKWDTGRVSVIPPVPPCDDPLADELALLIKDVTGQTGKFGEMGSGDLPHIVRGWGAKEFSLGVIRSVCNIHGKNEFVFRKDIEDLIDIIARFIT